MRWKEILLITSTFALITFSLHLSLNIILLQFYPFWGWYLNISEDVLMLIGLLCAMHGTEGPGGNQGLLIASSIILLVGSVSAGISYFQYSIQNGELKINSIHVTESKLPLVICEFTVFLVSYTLVSIIGVNAACAGFNLCPLRRQIIISEIEFFNAENDSSKSNVSNKQIEVYFFCFILLTKLLKMTSNE